MRDTSAQKQIIRFLKDVEQSPIDIGRDKELSMLKRQALAGKGGREEVRYGDKMLYEEAFHGQKYDLVLVGKWFSITTVQTPLHFSRRDVPKNGAHTVDQLLEFATLLDIEKKYDFSLEVPSIAPQLSDGTLIQIEQPYVLFNLGASIPEKYWTAKGFSEVGEWCNARGYSVALLGTGEERALADRIVIPRSLDLVPEEGINLGLDSFVNLARGASAIVSGDTGLLHLADASGALGIGLYGPTSPKEYAPYHNREGVVSTYHADRQMESIPASSVIALLEKQLPHV
jgi:ADP-heptose:LPS heptosyltransferase